MGLAGLWDAPRPGRRRKWLPENMAVISEKLETEQRTYSSGLLEVGKSFEYGLALKSFKSESYILTKKEIKKESNLRKSYAN